MFWGGARRIEWNRDIEREERIQSSRDYSCTYKQLFGEVRWSENLARISGKRRAVHLKKKFQNLSTYNSSLLFQSLPPLLLFGNSFSPLFCLTSFIYPYLGSRILKSSGPRGTKKNSQRCLFLLLPPFSSSFSPFNLSAECQAFNCSAIHKRKRSTRRIRR